MSQSTVSIRFPQGQFAELRSRLLEDSTQEAFAVLFGQRETVGEQVILKVKAVRYPRRCDYASRGLAHLRLEREYIYGLLAELQSRFDVDTLIDVHTHPFLAGDVAFSSVDDRDETTFYRWLSETFDEVYYASIVLSQSDYSAREWRLLTGTPTPQPALIRTQTLPENWPSADQREFDDEAILLATDPKAGFLARSVLALGLDTLRQVMQGQSIAVVGVGGLGSIIAEHLVHTGFHDLHLIDPDHVEVTNLNRIVGAYHADALAQRLKVEVVKDHLQRINPQARVQAHPIGIEDERLLPVLANVDWIIVGTDSHFSRFKAQEIALRYGVPLISVGVNISVDAGKITDMSGEVVVTRSGDGLCLHCLGRINPTKVAAEAHKELFIGQELVKRGYVTGQDVKEPAVKTLNAMLGAMAVDVLLNQYTQRQEHLPVIVYDNNKHPCIYPDSQSVFERNPDCFVCSID
ncbi:MAG TPA: hypothetical protein DCS21_02825 [Gammaproteobacteria bacterium]|nr:hypothetical protein [Gammaproteobacteria bacterium]